MPRIEPASVLPDAVEQSLIAERDVALDWLSALLRERGDGEFTDAATRQHIQLIRRVAVIDTARRGRGLSVLTSDELACLRTQGVPVD